MKKLSLFRFGTYGLLLTATFLAVRQHYVIPVNLNVFGVSESTEVSAWRANGNHPNFGDTILSGSEILRLADDAITDANIPLNELDAPEIKLELTNGRLVWRITREVSRSLGDGTIWVLVFIDDKNSETRVERYKH